MFFIFIILLLFFKVLRAFLVGCLHSYLVLMLLLVVDYVVRRLLKHLIQRLAHYDGIDFCLFSLLIPILFSHLIVLWIALMSQQLLVTICVAEYCRPVLDRPFTFHLTVL